MKSEGCEDAIKAASKSTLLTTSARILAKEKQVSFDLGVAIGTFEFSRSDYSSIRSPFDF
jgi:hypothetical protein